MATKTETDMLARLNGYLAYLDTLEEDSISRKMKFTLESFSFEQRIEPGQFIDIRPARQLLCR